MSRASSMAWITVSILMTTNQAFSQETGTWSSIFFDKTDLLSGSISTTYYDESDSILYLGGDFTFFSDAYTAHSIIGFDLTDSSWISLQEGVTGTVTSIAGMEDTVYMGGWLYDASDTLMESNEDRLDSIIWNSNPLIAYAAGSFDTIGLFQGPISCLHSHDDLLYAAGLFDSVNGIPARHIAVWDGSSWDDVAGGVNGLILAMLYHDSALYIAGRFDSAGGDAAANIARWDGSAWNAIDSLLQGTIHSMVEFDNAIVVGGDFRIPSLDLLDYNIARLTGSGWDLGLGRIDGDVLDLDVADSTLVACGTFRSIDGDSTIQGIAKYTDEWSSYGQNIEGVIRNVSVRQIPSLILGDFLSMDSSASLSQFMRVYQSDSGRFSKTLTHPNQRSIRPLHVMVDMRHRISIEYYSRDSLVHINEQVINDGEYEVYVPEDFPRNIAIDKVIVRDAETDRIIKLFLIR